MSWTLPQQVGFLPDPSGGDPILAPVVAADVAAEAKTALADQQTSLALQAHGGYDQALKTIDEAKKLWNQVVIQAMTVLNTDYGALPMDRLVKIAAAANAFKVEGGQRFAVLNTKREALLADQVAPHQSIGLGGGGFGGLGPAGPMAPHPIIPPGTITTGPGPSAPPTYQPAPSGGQGATPFTPSGTDGSSPDGAGPDGGAAPDATLQTAGLVAGAAAIGYLLFRIFVKKG